MLRNFGLSAAFLSVTTLFFAWGFVTSNNDPLIASLKASFDLSWTQALMTQLVSFAAYGVMALPAASLLGRVGPVRAIIAALTLMVVGAAMVSAVTQFHSYELILAALFVLGVGITILQVAANPLAAALGPPEKSHFRLTFAQGFNSLGVVLGVNFGSKIMLGDDVMRVHHSPITDPLQRTAALGAVGDAFVILAVMMAALLLFIWWSRRTIAAAAHEVVDAQGDAALAALRSKWALWGAVTIGLYVGAEVSIGSIMINFLSQPHVLDISLEMAGFYLANIYWMGALIGRFVGSYLLTRIAAPKLLLAAAAVATGLCATVALSEGAVAAYAALGVGLFNSIMFPTIFTITLERSGVSQSSTSGLLCLAIVGGAALPYAVGKFADNASLTLAFIVPMAAYAMIALFAAMAARIRPLPTIKAIA
ncbi:MAG: MFS transporter [Sphingopyxis sp.]